MNDVWVTVSLAALLLARVSLGLECSGFQQRRVKPGDAIVFQSAGYPSNYRNLDLCSAFFHPASGNMTMQLVCGDVDIFQDTGRSARTAFAKFVLLGGDQVLLTLGAERQQFPASTNFAPVSWTTSPGQSIKFLFHSDIVDTARGFSCTVIGDDPTPPPQRNCGMRNEATARSARRLVHLLRPSVRGRLLGRDRSGRQVFPEDNKIFGGEDAGPNEYPWMVLLDNVQDRGTTRCAGTIISENYVLTAAHCFPEDMTGVMTFVRYGASSSDSPDIQAQLAESVTIHPAFSTGPDGALFNDVALIKLPTPLEFSDEVMPVCLPSFSDQELTHTPGTGTITGWGTTGNEEPVTSDLQEATATLLDLATCSELTGGAASFQQVCTNPLTGTSVCPGDSGGPLKIQEEDGKFTQIGITSYGGISCEADSEFAVYTRVDQYLDWIRDNSDVTIM